MCGLCGAFETAGAALTREQLRRMTEALAHRGPDAAGAALAPHGGAVDSRLDAAPVALGHRRLSIVDLSAAADQPMLFEDGRLAVVFNGEIYNFREIAAAHFADRRPLTTGDTEIIGWAYRRWGLDCFTQFNGFFAIAIYDAAADRLVLARDRVGKKPLYYFHDNGHFAFASELKSLALYPAFAAELDRRALDQYLALGYVPGELCIYEKCRKLPAGGWLTIDGAGRLATGRWHDAFADAAAPEWAGSAAEAEAELERLLGDAVRLRLIADVPLGAFLSGGVDSSLIVAAMCEQSTTRPRTFTIAFDEPRFNEGPYAAAVAKHLGTEHTELVARPRDALDLLDRLPEICDEPLADPSILPTTLLSQLTRKHVTVALSGDGGDELFGGYNRYQRAFDFARLLAAPGGPAAAKAGRAALANATAPAWRRVADLLAQPSADALFLRQSGLFAPAEFTALTRRPYPADHALAAALARAAALPLHRRLRAADLVAYLGDDILTKVDRASMRPALEARAPLLDHRIVRFAFSLPRHLLLRGRVRKHLLKRLLYRRIPASLFRRPKAGFDLPLSEWLRGELRPLLDRCLAADRLRRQGLFDAGFVDNLIARHQAGEAREANKLFALLVFQLWWDKNLGG